MLCRSSDTPTCSMISSTAAAERNLGKVMGFDPTQVRESQKSSDTGQPPGAPRRRTILAAEDQLYG
jgi:hypothetical protein